MIVTPEEYLIQLQANGAVISPAGLALLEMRAPLLQKQIEATIGYPIERATYTEYYPSAVTNYAGGGDYLVGNWDMINGRAVAQVRDQQYRRMLGTNKLPVRNIIEIRENMGAWDGGPDGNTFPYFPDTSILPPSSYRADWEEAGICFSGRIIRNHGIWIRDLRSIQVEYEAGFSQDELDNGAFSDLKVALLEMITTMYIGSIMRANAAVNGGWLSSESMTDHSVSFGDPSAIGIISMNDYTYPPTAQRIVQRYVNMRMFFQGN